MNAVARASLALVLASACEGSDEDSALQFVALQRDFADFAEWEVVWTELRSRDGLAHAAGVREIRVNRDPSEIVEPVPMGTIVLKTVADDELGEVQQIHAMVKRGGGYNPDGIPGWEWFDLGLDDEARPVIRWRGEHPPDGECYGCAPGTDPEEAARLGDCNNCHAGAHDGLHTLSDWR